MYPQARRNWVKGIDDKEIQIIGIEFTMRDSSGQNQEIAMFSPQGLIIPRLNTIPPYGHFRYQPKITFHTTDGDYAIEDYNGRCPW